MRVLRHARYAAALALLAAGACSADDPVAPTTGPLDVPALLGEAALPSSLAPVLSASVGPAGAFALSTPDAAAWSGCAWADAQQAFACAAATVNGLTFTRAYTPLDAAGNVQRTPERATTAGIRMTSTIAGSVASPAGAGGASTIAQRQELTLGGLLAGPRRLDGTSTLDLTTPASDGTALAVRATQTIAGLVLPAAGARWPAAGTISTDLGVNGQALLRAVMTFDGTSTVALVYTQAGQTLRCTLDLAAATPAPSCPQP